jgi:hypothetical protein
MMCCSGKSELRPYHYEATSVPFRGRQAGSQGGSRHHCSDTIKPFQGMRRIARL